MPRPPKPRNICEMPKYSVYGPKGVQMNKLNTISMSIDELETIKLIDYSGYNQEEAAKQMNVARTTVQRIYEIARKKVSQSLIDGSVLVIEGGHVVMCNDDCEQCLGARRGMMRGRNYRNRE
jgi:predicted DNA-binding protein (UPF0251 family)